MLDLVKRKWKVIVSVGAIIIAAGGLGWYFLGSKDTVAAQAATVMVSKGKIEVTVSGTGAVQPALVRNVTPKVGGTLSNINFENGSKVEEGDLLFTLNTDSIQAEIKNVQLELEQAELSYDDIVEKLKQQEATSSNGQNQQQNTVSTNSKASQALKVEQVKLNLSNLKKKLKDYKIYAPADGIISLSSQAGGNSGSGSNSASSGSSSSTSGTSGQSYLQEGDLVSTSQVLATIVDSSGMLVTVPVDEVDISKVKAGQKATITADALPDKNFNGTVQEIAAEGTASNGVTTFDVTVSIDKPEGLKTNMTANVEIMVASKDEALLLPIEAVQERMGRKFVLLPTGESDSENNGKALEAGAGFNKQAGNADSGGNFQRARGNMTSVETGLYNETMIEITSGLKEGDTVTLPTTTSSSNSNNKAMMGAGGIMFGGPPDGGRARSGAAGGGNSSQSSGAGGK